MKGGKTMAKDKKSSGEKTSMMDKKPDLVPPDGGWGWMVAFAFALSNVIIVPILQSFGLLFREKFATLGINGRDASVIINLNSAFGMILGLFNGFLLRSYGYRKITVVGALINSLGVILTSQADSFVYFLITYGIISSVGFNLVMSGLSLAINTFFRERRGKAVGFGATAMGLGPVFMPLIISKLMDVYGVSGTALILGALSLHSVVAGLLLQPIKWHMKPRKLTPEEMEEAKEEVKDVTEQRKSLNGEELTTRRVRTITEPTIDHDNDVHSVYGFETPLPERSGSGKRRMSSSSYRRSSSHVEDAAQQAANLNWWSSAASLETVNLGSNAKIYDEKLYKPLRETDEDDHRHHKHRKEQEKSKGASTQALTNVNTNTVEVKNKNGDIPENKVSKNEDDDKEKEEKEKKLSFWRRVGRFVTNFFDLGLFKDPIYVNLMVGMSLAICAELNFSLLTPFILADRGFNTDDTAIIMSVIAGLDIVFRFITPFFSDHYKIQARNMYIVALIMLVSSRSALIFSTSFQSVLAVAIALGVAKGVRTVYMSLVIPSYVPIERLPSASGIQMVVNGLLLMAFGPLIGVIRDVTGNYNLCIAFINFLTVLTLTMWISEILIILYRRRKKQNANNDN